MSDQFTLYHGNCLDVLKKLDDNSIDSCVTDPPYGLNFMGKKWDYDVPKKEIWQEVLRVLKPGAHLLAFFGTRTYHRGVCEIENAGFEIRDQIQWLYGSGFPKSHNIGNGWGTAFKPANEPIVVARKPLSEKTVAENVLKWGTGAINIDGSRVKYETVDGGSLVTNTHLRDKIKGGNTRGNVFPAWPEEKESRFFVSHNLGRWPANVIHDGSDEVVDEFAKYGEKKSCMSPSTAAPEGTILKGKRTQGNLPMDTGTAARFFYCAKASKADRDEGLENFLAKKKAGAEFRPNHMKKALQGKTGNPYGRWDKIKNIHPTVKPTSLMEYLCVTVTPKGGMILDPFMGSGSTGKAAILKKFKFIGIEVDKTYLEISQARIKHAAQNKVCNLEEFFA